MSDLRSQLERLRDGQEPRPRSFQRLVLRRRRKQRNERLLAGVVALALATGGTLLAVRAFTGTPAERRQELGGEVRNGNIAFKIEGEGIYVVKPKGGQATKLVKGSDPGWSPDGEMLAFRTPLGSDSVAHIAVVTADGWDVRHLTTRQAGVTGAGPPTWSPDGRTLAFSDAHGLWTISIDGSDLRKVTSYDGSFACYDLSPDWSPDGLRIVFALRCDGTDQGIFVVNADGSERTQLTGAGVPPDATAGGYSDRYPVWSPDGTKIAFIRAGAQPEGYEPNVYAMNADGSGVTQLTHEGLYETRPEWSPDGSRIAFSDFHGRLFTMAPDGSDVQRIPDIEGCCPSWQPLVSGSDASLPAIRETPSFGVSKPVQQRSGSTISELGLNPAGGPYLAFGSVWVVMYEDTDAFYLLGLDPQTMAVRATIPLEGWASGWVSGEGGFAAGADALWVAGASDSGAIIYRIDPSTNAVNATLRAGGGSVSDVVVADSGVWASVLGDELSMSAARFDAATNRLIAQIPVTGEWIREIVAIDDLIVVRTRRPETLTVIDASTNEVVVSKPSQGFHGPIAARGGVIWANSGNALARIDPTTLEVVETIPVGSSISSTGLVPDGDGFWFVGYDSSDETVPATLVRFNPELREVEKVLGLPDDSRAFTLGAGHLWVLGYEGRLTRIDLES